MPVAITYRRVKGQPLTNDEIDDNFENLATEVDDGLSATQELAEFDTEQKRTNARTNLGVQVIDLGTFN